MEKRRAEQQAGDMNEEVLYQLTTEQINEETRQLDQLSTKGILQLMNQEDMKIAEAVQDVIPDIEKVTEGVFASLNQGGRLFYVGAGTSGRLGVLDASECPPTFRTSHDMVQAVMAGGNHAIFEAVEGAEDDVVEGKRDLEARQITPFDVVIGISASGRTPYVLGALKYAQKVGTKAYALSANANAQISTVADAAIEVIVGPEVLSGSTRLKAATAHKMILNMISTTVMVKLGKVYENLMVDVHASNHKLRDRAMRIVTSVTQVSEREAVEALESCDYQVKVAVVMLKANVSAQEARALLTEAKGYVREAIQLAGV
ncbi:N-acetylmuramic acid 6-phosphate etherase [Caldalkalibacillus salinus]|uniref:N-acetylmuramic acid 6-phosphate etherase n=1 Tax=Caldalkalibacillus salinus TaxID=2803787 RepID=UPI001F02D78C|nr:N-acetylmuramic acid 6-phosphate etherase [Caldalkalibacillus salinus]